MALPKFADFWTLNFNFKKLNSFFNFLTATLSGCLLWRLWSWNICFGLYNSTFKSWIPLFYFTAGERADVPNVAGTEIDWLWDCGSTSKSWICVFALIPAYLTYVWEKLCPLAESRGRIISNKQLFTLDRQPGL